MRKTNALGLSPTEKAILDVLWRKRNARVREVYKLIKSRFPVAHTSVAVFLDRLYEKKIVTRKIESCRGGYRYLYSPSSSKDEFDRKSLQLAVDSLIDRFGQSAVAYFSERFGKE